MDKEIIEVGIIGNPNTGKTSLFNCLTGAFQHVGNWPGKTVEKKEGKVSFKGYIIKFVDLPGTYSVAPYSEEEKIARDYILSPQPDLIIQTVDVNTLKRNLLLTFEIASLGKKLILVFNFGREAKRKGAIIKTARIEEKLEIPIVEVEAHTGENKQGLLKVIVQTYEGEQKTPDYIDRLVKTKEEINHIEARKFLENILKNIYRLEDGNSLTGKIDRFLLNKYTALPIFFLVLGIIFQVTFTLSGPLIELINNLLGGLGNLALKTLTILNLPSWVGSLVIDGVIDGVGSVLTFTPLIFTLFFLIAILEDSGYLARTVFLVDKLFEKLGLTGRAFIPMILGFGCNVPAIMATRTIHDKREKFISILINPFMSCSARLPVYVLLTGVFFRNYQALVIMGLYLLGVIIAFLSAFSLSRILPGGEEATLILELPPYRLPTLRNVFLHTWSQGRHFIQKAGTIIFVAVLIIWFLASFPFGVDYGSKQSLLGQFGQAIVPIFKPLGFGKWTFSVALIFGFVAKEVIIGTLGTLYGVGKQGLIEVLPQVISPLSALSLMVFVLLYVPCMATVAVIKKETGSWKWTIFQVGISTLIAWLMAFIVYTGGIFLGFL